MLIAVVVAVPLPKTVEQATGWPEVTAEPRRIDNWPPHLVRVKVGRRNPRVIKEWRDRRQTFAIFWDAASDGYRAMQIRGKRYVPIPASTSAGRPRKVWPTFEDANNQVDAHWRFLIGKEPRTYAPSPKLRRINQRTK